LKNEQANKREAKYQSPSLVIFAKGNILFKAAGTFPEKDGRTKTKSTLNQSTKFRRCGKHFETAKPFSP